MPTFLNIRSKGAIPLLSLFLINIYLIYLPLTNSLGYEFVLVNSVILFIIAGYFTSKKLKTETSLSFFSFILTNRFALLSYLVIPLIVGLFSSFFNSMCPINDGLAFYITILLPAFIIGIILAFLSSSITAKYNRYIFSLITLFLILASLLEFYLLPQVYFYNPLFGFFPGTIYDEDISVNISLILFQFFNLSLFGIGLYFITKLNSKLKTLQKTAFIILLLSFSVLLKLLIGFSTTKSKLEKELRNKITTEHFEIFLGDSVKKSDYEFIALQHEYYYERVKERLQLNDTPLITSFLFNDKIQKRKLFGAGNADVAKPWMNMIFLNYTNYQSTLKHEIVHAVAAKFGVTPFRVAENINSAMIEGLAMFIENDFDGFTVNYGAKLAYNNNYKVNLKDLFNSGKFFTNYSSLAYIYSGAFLEFISNKFGIDKVKNLYADLNFEKILGESFNSLVIQFEEYLTDSNFSGKQNEAQLYFGGQTIFKKFCPRMAANELKEAQNEFVKKNYYLSAEKYLSVYKYAASASALNGYIVSLKKLKKYNHAITVLEKEINKFNKSQSLYNLELQLADCYLLSGDTIKANHYYNIIEKQNPHQNYLDWINLLKIIWKHEGSERLKIFLSANETERTNVLLNLYDKTKNIWIIQFLPGLDIQETEKMKKIFEELYEGSKISDYTSRKAAVIISNLLLKKKRYESAKLIAIKAVENFTDENRKISLVENLRMVNWFVNFAPETKLKIEPIK